MTIHRIRTAILATFGLLGLSVGALQAQADLRPAQVDSIIEPYLAIQEALASDDLATAKDNANQSLQALSEANGSGVGSLQSSAQAIAQAADLRAARTAFQDLSQEITTLVKELGVAGERDLYIAHCPMAFGSKGGEWVQSSKTVANPYYGASMLRCGSIQEQIAGGEEGESAKKHQGHEHMGHGGMDHSAMNGDMDRDQHFAAELDRMHAGVPDYQAQSTLHHAQNTSEGEGTLSSSDCGMSCCATAKN